MVETTKQNLSRLEMSIKSDYCIIVEGALSSGKTSLIQQLADKYNKKFIKYQMDDFMDSKVSLIFCCLLFKK
jgi:chloramphenicol 3-O-phosphotransferase